MPMIDFDRLAKGNGVGWSQESIVVALCAEIGQLRLRILALEAVAHAPVALLAPSSSPPPSEEPLEGESGPCCEDHYRDTCVHGFYPKEYCWNCFPSPSPTREEPR